MLGVGHWLLRRGMKVVVLLIDWVEDVRGAKDVSRLQVSGRVVMTSVEMGKPG